MSKSQKVVKVENIDGAKRFVMTSNDSIIFYADGSFKCFNCHGLGFSSKGRFAHIAQDMRRKALAHRS